MSWSLRIATLNKGGRFDLAAFMASQSDGFWYDFAKTDRLFQENIGPTPADDPNEVIGLALSSRLWNGASLAQVLAAAPELVTNPGGPFSDATGWTQQQGTMSVVSGKLRATRAAGSNGRVTAPISCVVGRTYSLEITGIFATATSSVVIANSTGSAAGAPLSVTTNGRYYFTASQSTHYVMLLASAGADGTYVEIGSASVKEVSRYAATQSSGSLKPKFQTTGAAFDALDDYLATGYIPGATANFMIAKTTVPVSLSAVQVIAGCGNASPAQRFWMAIDTSGKLCGGVGTQSATTIVGGSDLRGTEVVVGLSVSGAEVKLFAGSSEIYSAAQSGDVPNSTSRAVYLGGNNNNGTSGSFYGGSIKSILSGRQHLDLTTFNKISRAL